MFFMAKSVYFYFYDCIFNINYFLKVEPPARVAPVVLNCTEKNYFLVDVQYIVYWEDVEDTLTLS